MHLDDDEGASSARAHRLTRSWRSLPAQPLKLRFKRHDPAIPLGERRRDVGGVETLQDVLQAEMASRAATR